MGEMIPFYYALKVCLFAWLCHPKFMGAGLVYKQLIKPLLMPYFVAFEQQSKPQKKEEWRDFHLGSSRQHWILYMRQQRASVDRSGCAPCLILQRKCHQCHICMSPVSLCLRF